MKHSHNFIDLTGQTFGRLTVLKHAGKAKSGQILWLCVCLYGEKACCAGYRLRGGTTISCGCYAREVAAEICKVNRKASVTKNTTHGHARGKRSPEYCAWHSMLSRAENHAGHYPTYVNVRACPEWLTFKGFLAAMGERPEGTTLGRILDRGNYEPGNVFWMTQEEQNLARRNNHALAAWEQSRGNNE